jgi:hypothetical protein
VVHVHAVDGAGRRVVARALKRDHAALPQVLEDASNDKYQTTVLTCVEVLVEVLVDGLGGAADRP